MPVRSAMFQISLSQLSQIDWVRIGYNKTVKSANALRGKVLPRLSMNNGVNIFVVGSELSSQDALTRSPCVSSSNLQYGNLGQLRSMMCCPSPTGPYMTCSPSNISVSYVVCGSSVVEMSWIAAGRIITVVTCKTVGRTSVVEFIGHPVRQNSFSVPS